MSAPDGRCDCRWFDPAPGTPGVCDCGHTVDQHTTDGGACLQAPGGVDALARAEQVKGLLAERFGTGGGR